MPSPRLKITTAMKINCQRSKSKMLAIGSLSKRAPNISTYLCLVSISRSNPIFLFVQCLIHNSERGIADKKENHQICERIGHQNLSLQFERYHVIVGVKTKQQQQVNAPTFLQVVKKQSQMEMSNLNAIIYRGCPTKPFG